MNLGDYIDRLAASLGIDTSGLIKSDQQKQMEQMQAQQMQQQQMLEQTAMGAAGSVGTNIGSQITPEQLAEVMEQAQ